MAQLFLFAGTFMAVTGCMVLYCLLFEREPYDGGQPQWRDE